MREFIAFTRPTTRAIIARLRRMSKIIYGYNTLYFGPRAILNLIPPRTMHPPPNPDFMRRAIALASENVRSGRGGPFGAVVVKEGAIIGEGFNTVTRDNDPTAHAEVNAIRAASRSLSAFTLAGCEIYTSCEPCPMCLAALYWARIERIWFGNTSADAARVNFDDAILYRQIALPAHDRSIPSSMLLHDAAWESFQLWLDSPDKTLY
jgi:guanine deaminase